MRHTPRSQTFNQAPPRRLVRLGEHQVSSSGLRGFGNGEGRLGRCNLPRGSMNAARAKQMLVLVHARSFLN